MLFLLDLLYADTCEGVENFYKYENLLKEIFFLLSMLEFDVNRIENFVMLT
jgi:hypothetical protein